MDQAITEALRHSGTVDITTTGRRTGLARRIEIQFHAIDGRVYISGIPWTERERAWLSNLRADPRLTFHLKGPVVADLDATATVIDDPKERRPILERIAPVWRQDPERMLAHSPLVEVVVVDRLPAESGRRT